MTARHAAFLGTWILDPTSCAYEQGAPPRSGRYTITERGDELAFTIEWTDAAGEDHRAEFSGRPDGQARPFAGGPLADAMSITCRSPRELNSAAFYGGVELMSAERQLDATGQAMRVVQMVRLPDGSRPTNVAIYRRQTRN